ncbi:Crp/Fnr family transcriptional regulator [Chitinophaga agrisoli]|uniref:Crp/Fnr family transcriptional regulator n=1 Tax=Chitinophaga agrisoli TaxID=2607653 RepID=A0A5B2VWE7_9BACT|nr:Crp/Fnr family transcriptional regulator [Chitinophaga agrisoli]KAA2242577.1 Crp/Fnr family transcriptional regulator [Chitinophaga agrisoli]
MFAPLFDFLEQFRSFSHEDKALISEQVHHRQVKEGELLLQEGSLARELFFISQGILKIVTINGKGNEVTQFFLKENQFCTILNSFNNQVPAHESIVAACNGELIVFPKDHLLRLYEQLPYMKELITGITQNTLLEKIRVRNGYMGEDAATRYEKFLEKQPEIALRVQLSDVASYLGVTPQSLSRIRKNMR